MATPKRPATFEAACKAQGLDPNKVIPDVSMLPEQDRKAVIALAKLCIIQRSLNGDWTPDWNDYNQYKYYPWFDVNPKEESPSGFGLSYGDCVCDLTVSGLGVRLYYKDRETAEYAATKFVSLYEDLILVPR